MVANVFDVAKYILHSQGKMSTWKLQKLCFYSQAWSLAWTEKPLFNEDFEAWANGPVCRDLFNLHKGQFVIDEDDFQQGNIKELSDDELETINIVIRDYGGMAPFELRELSHSEDPWKNARGNTPEGEYCDTVINKQDIGNYYGAL